MNQMGRDHSGQSHQNDAELNNFNLVSEGSQLTHQNMDVALQYTFDRLIGVEGAYQGLLDNGMIDLVVHGEIDLDENLLNAILRFVAGDAERGVFALCRGQVVHGQITGATHWIALHVRRIGNQLQFYVMDSTNGQIPPAVTRVIAQLNHFSEDLRELSPEIRNVDLFANAANQFRLHGLQAQAAQQLPAQQQGANNHCGDHTAFNMAWMFNSHILDPTTSNSLNLSVDLNNAPTVYSDFHQQFRAHLINQFNPVAVPNLLINAPKIELGNKRYTKTKDVNAGKNSRGGPTLGGFYQDGQGNEFFIKQPLDLVEAFTEGLAGEILTKLKTILPIAPDYCDSLITAEIGTATQDDRTVPILIQPKKKFVELHNLLHTSKQKNNQPINERSNWDEMRQRDKTPYAYYFLDGRPKFGTTHAILFSLLVGDYSVHSSNVAIISSADGIDQVAKIDFGAAFRYYTQNDNSNVLWPYEYTKSSLKDWYKNYISYYTQIPGFTDALALTAESYLAGFTINLPQIQQAIENALTNVLDSLNLEPKLQAKIHSTTGLEANKDMVAAQAKFIADTMLARLEALAAMKPKGLSASMQRLSVQSLLAQECEAYQNQVVAMRFRSNSYTHQRPVIEPGDISNPLFGELQVALLQATTGYLAHAQAVTFSLINRHGSKGGRKIRALQQRIEQATSFAQLDAAILDFFSNNLRDEQGLIGGDINANPHSFISFLMDNLRQLVEQKAQFRPLSVIFNTLNLINQQTPCFATTKQIENLRQTVIQAMQTCAKQR